MKVKLFKAEGFVSRTQEYGKVKLLMLFENNLGTLIEQKFTVTHKHLDYVSKLEIGSKHEIQFRELPYNFTSDDGEVFEGTYFELYSMKKLADAEKEVHSPSFLIEEPDEELPFDIKD